MFGLILGCAWGLNGDVIHIVQGISVDVSSKDAWEACNKIAAYENKPGWWRDDPEDKGPMFMPEGMHEIYMNIEPIIKESIEYAKQLEKEDPKLKLRGDLKDSYKARAAGILDESMSAEYPFRVLSPNKVLDDVNALYEIIKAYQRQHG